MQPSLSELHKDKNLNGEDCNLEKVVKCLMLSVFIFGSSQLKRDACTVLCDGALSDECWIETDTQSGVGILCSRPAVSGSVLTEMLETVSG